MLMNELKPRIALVRNEMQNWQIPFDRLKEEHFFYFSISFSLDWTFSIEILVEVSIFFRVYSPSITKMICDFQNQSIYISRTRTTILKLYQLKWEVSIWYIFRKAHIICIRNDRKEFIMNLEPKENSIIIFLHKIEYSSQPASVGKWAIFYVIA